MKLILRLSAAVAFLALWQLVVTVGHISPLVLPSPLDSAHAIVSHFGDLVHETSITAMEAILGFLASAITAYVVAVGFVWFRPLEIAMMPYAVALKSIPLVALAPLIVMWCGEGIAGKIVMSAIVSFWPILIGSVQGMRAVKPDALSLMASLGATPWQVLTKLRIPNSVGYTFASLKIASSLAVVGAVIAELVGSSHGIGHLINENTYYLHTDVVFAAIVFISAVAVALFAFLALLENRFRFWRESALD